MVLRVIPERPSHHPKTPATSQVRRAFRKAARRPPELFRGRARGCARFLSIQMGARIFPENRPGLRGSVTASS